MIVSKSFYWLLPFLHAVEGILPRMKKLKEVRIMRSSVIKRNRVLGEITKYIDGTFSIKIRSKGQHIDLDPLKITLKPSSKVDILSHLAHELAHLYHWEHTPEHKILECQILTIFMYKLKQQGYISEEKELDEAE